jgi:hypothetical protein
MKRTTVIMWGANGLPLKHVPAVAKALGIDPSEIWPALAVNPAAPAPREAA